jgi:Cyclic nucleotide-binding domain.
MVNNLRVGQRIAGDVIGETAMDTEKPRIADVIAEESLVLLRLKKIDYKSILANLKRLEKYENSKFLMTIEFFSK